MKIKVKIFITLFVLLTSVLVYHLFNLNGKLKEVNSTLKYLYESKNLNNKTNYIVADLEIYSYDELNQNMKEISNKIHDLKRVNKKFHNNILELEDLSHAKNELIESLKSDSAIVNNSLRNSFKLFGMFSKELNKEEYIFIHNEILTKMLITKNIQTSYKLDVRKQLEDLFTYRSGGYYHTMELFLTNIRIFEEYIARYNILHKKINAVKVDNKIEAISLKLKNEFDMINNEIKNTIFLFIFILLVILMYLIFSNSKLNQYSIEIKKQKVQLEHFSNNLEIQVEEQTGKISEQLENITRINHELGQNINFAAGIQNSILPLDDDFDEFFQDKFVLWKPKDVVGGDIYFFETLKNKDECLIMLIDCTGHGVYGAFLTMLVKALENQILELIEQDDYVIDTADILNKFNTLIQKVIKSKKIYAGFDGQIMYYNKKTKLMKIASANNDVYYIKNNEFHTIKATKKTIGYSKKRILKKEFVQNELIIEKDMVLYLSSDGYVDQFGENDEFPYGKKRFQKLLLDNHTKDFATQKDILVSELSKFRGKEERMDDIAIIGLKF